MISDSELKRENILFIGNSITLHGKCSYWWGEWGMAASDRELDYVHQVVKGLNKPVEGQKRGGTTKFKSFNFFAWEVMAHDRAEALQLIEELLHRDLTAVVIQLGENVNNLTSLEDDYGELIDFIAKKVPQSKIIMLDNVWNLPFSHEMKRRVSKNKGIDFIDLSDMWDDESLFCGLGTSVKGDDNEFHTVEHKGVAGHPGDEYMAEIARRILNCL